MDMSQRSVNDLWGCLSAPSLDVAELGRVLQQLETHVQGRGSMSDSQAANLLSTGWHLLSQPSNVLRDTALLHVLHLLSLWRGRAAARTQLSAGVSLDIGHWQVVAGAQQLVQELVTAAGPALEGACKLPDVLILLAACSLGAPQHLAHTSWALAADMLAAWPAVQTSSGLLEQWEQLLPAAALLLRACSMHPAGGMGLGWLSAALLLHLEAGLRPLLMNSGATAARHEGQHHINNAYSSSSSSSSSGSSSGCSSSNTSSGGMDTCAPGVEQGRGTSCGTVDGRWCTQDWESREMLDLAHLTAAAAMLVDLGQQLVAPSSSRGQPPTLPLSPQALGDLLRGWQELVGPPSTLLCGVLAAAIATGFHVAQARASQDQPHAQQGSWQLVISGAGTLLNGCVAAAAAVAAADGTGPARVDPFLTCSMGWCLAQQHRSRTNQQEEPVGMQGPPMESLAAAMCCCSALMCCSMMGLCPVISPSSSVGKEAYRAMQQQSIPNHSAGPSPAAAAAAAAGLHRLAMGAPAVAAALVAAAEPLPLLQRAEVVHALADGVQGLVMQASSRAAADGDVSPTLQRCFIAVSLVLMRLQRGVPLNREWEAGTSPTHPDVQQRGGSSNFQQNGNASAVAAAAAEAAASVVAHSLIALLYLGPYRVEVPGYVGLVTGLVAQLTQSPRAAAAFLDTPLVRGVQPTQGLPAAVLVPLLPLAATALCCLVRTGWPLPPKSLTLLVCSLCHPEQDVAAAAAAAYADVLAAAVDHSRAQDVMRTVPAALNRLLHTRSSGGSGSDISVQGTSVQALQKCWPHLLQVCRCEPALTLWACNLVAAACLQGCSSQSGSSTACAQAGPPVAGQPRSAGLEGVLLSSPLFISIQQLPDVLQLLGKLLQVMPPAQRKEALSGLYQRVVSSDDVPRKLPLLRWLQQQVQAAEYAGADMAVAAEHNNMH